MTVLSIFTQQPADVLDYDVEYADFLVPPDALASATVAVTPTGLTVAAPVKVGTRYKLWVSGGTSSVTYKVTITVTTTLGRTKQDELKFKIKDV